MNSNWKDGTETEISQENNIFIDRMLMVFAKSSFVYFTGIIYSNELQNLKQKQINPDDSVWLGNY